MVNINYEWELRMGKLSATNLGSVMLEAQASPAFRATMIRNFEARAVGKLSTEERMWLAWCRAIK
ncbi:hypothetical protein [Pseudomonas sp. RIT411]|uniref:hypothetical protein n=1 Tax=Pseudomonas sp. RIT411 TaxID=2202160 RepID=UPI000D3D539A|nr:hypothetical protein [Pseudomonas sp. RIT 411]RAU39224.1 hypothetical protein DBY63_012140 [Pseudomonas sp. RIT 411]